ncbi:NADH dehydrogenase [ubiquinone] iron-sulfur protein 5 [Vanessa atalanta]|uniref:NADH dehydrogenase [ubiquinone] iron-sulfur protein 5-like n=1 Tax=Vanessa cardui TaxID=171605 RepID=UPI001F129E3A|nr:NADH dehydrogenase [ubiquinone] iron-sulfur protein 5-like [Vanessa cardui]XP_047536008.1 NADH dehydrogenase [ubiquinone] iron-sulfur protein 5 [Vanessa atalanta]
MSISPYFRSPFTDITGGMVSHQMLGNCQKQEMRYMDCLEAYGLDRGRVKCGELFDDFHECQTKTKQFKRFVAIRKERERQIAEGKLKGDEKFLSPRVDSF